MRSTVIMCKGIISRSRCPGVNLKIGADVKKIFAAIRVCIRDMKGWDVVEESMLGLFSFNKFVMWNDIHSNAEKLKENAIIASLMENRIQWQDNVPEVDAREIDKTCAPDDFSIPIDVDSSQLEAVIESGEGRVLYYMGLQEPENRRPSPT